MKTRRAVITGVILAALWFLIQAAPHAVAQDQPPAPDQGQVQGQPPAPGEVQGQAQDPPGRVARLSTSIGSVSFQPGGQGDWVQAVPNRPLTTGDNFWADKDARAELQIGSTSMRIDSETSITILDLDDRTTQLRLSQGSLIVRIRHLDDEDRFEIDTPNSAFVIQRTGEYRVDVNADGNETDTTVWRGRGEVTGGGSSYIVVAGQRAVFTGTDQLNHEIQQIPAQDDFDEWAFNRDRGEDQAESTNYISPEMTGYQDLDEYGSWRYVADYGPVWTPAAVPVGWAPYRFGHWVWIAPWGWTWVEDEPWGFAPFHYGRWAFVGGGWCWVPGPVVVRPVFAPAFVAFVGGPAFSVGFGVGPGVAWFPLAPREVFVPWYRTTPGYVNSVNITNTRVNVTQVTNVYNTTIINNNTHITYVNQHVTNAVTAVSRETFVNARPVAQNLAKVDARQLESAPVARELPVQPTRQSEIGAGKATNLRPPPNVANRQVVATRMPSAPNVPRQTAENVRAETPGTPQPPQRIGQNQTPRPPVNTHLEEQGTAPRPEESTPAQRPSQPSQSARTGQAPAPPQHGVPRPPAGENGRSLVRQAPPVQNRPEVQRSEESKFNAWSQQRSQPSARAEAPSRPPAPAPHETPRK
jgi:hypothetical protein